MTQVQDLVATFNKDFDKAIKTVEALTEETMAIEDGGRGLAGRCCGTPPGGSSRP